MKKIVIKNLSGEETNSLIFATTELANQWITKMPVKNVWGNKERWVAESDLVKEGLLAADAVDSSVVSNPYPVGNEPLTFTIYKFPATFTYQIVDITLEIAAKNRAARGLKNQQFGASVIAQVYGINEEKFTLGTLDNTKFQAMLANTTLATIERLLWNGSIKSAKTLIEGLDTTYFTSAEKTFILNMINSYLATEG